MNWTEEFELAFSKMERTDGHILLTGDAGTGKSTLLTEFLTRSQKKIVVLAPTGVAALRVGGETIHSFFGFKPNTDMSEVRLKANRVRKPEKYESINTIVIDEISMVRADLLDFVDTFLRTVLKDLRPFGGIQLIMIGDFAQLPPVVTNDEQEHFYSEYATPFVHSSNVFQDQLFDYQKVSLSKVFRQEDPVFIELLNRVRHKAITQEDVALLNQKVCPQPPRDQGLVILTTTNKAAETINMKQLDAIKNPVFTYKASISGKFDSRMAPTPELLTLKEGAQVMFQMNDPMGRFVNGTVGIVKQVLPDSVLVATAAKGIIEVEPFEWKIYQYVFDEDEEKLIQKEMGAFTQLPLKLAWAITIHKSQSQTFDAVYIDFGFGTFAQGQTYVALSRCRNFDKLYLARPFKRSGV